MLDSMAAVAAALSLTPATPTLYLGLKMATMGLSLSNSKAGLFGVQLDALMKALQGGLGAALLKKVGLAKMQMLLMALLGTIGGAGTLAALFPNLELVDFLLNKKETTVLAKHLGLI